MKPSAIVQHISTEAQGTAKAPVKPESSSFERALDAAGVRLSKHAKDRIRSRGLEFQAEDAERISKTMTMLKGRGGNVSLLLMENAALVTDVRNRTVITALERYGESEQVFTQIDSAAFVEKA